jgi:hypothetical protein
MLVIHIFWFDYFGYNISSLILRFVFFGHYLRFLSGQDDFSTQAYFDGTVLNACDRNHSFNSTITALMPHSMNGICDGAISTLTNPSADLDTTGHLPGYDDFDRHQERHLRDTAYAFIS